jgi:hypothetical protein
MSRIISLGHTLVSQVTNLHPNDDQGDFRSMLDAVMRCVDYNTKAAPSNSMSDITKQLHGSVTDLALLLSTTDWVVVVLKEHGSARKTRGQMLLTLLSLC